MNDVVLGTRMKIVKSLSYANWLLKSLFWWVFLNPWSHRIMSSHFHRCKSLSERPNEDEKVERVSQSLSRIRVLLVLINLDFSVWLWQELYHHQGFLYTCCLILQLQLWRYYQSLLWLILFQLLKNDEYLSIPVWFRQDRLVLSKQGWLVLSK